MSQQRKIYLAVLLVAIAALVVDRALLSGGALQPEPAEGAPPSRAEGQTGGEAEAGGEAVDLDSVERALAQIDASVASFREGGGLAEAFATLAERRSLTVESPANAFAMPDHWKPDPEPERSVSDGGDAGPGAVALFEREHKLQAVMQHSEGEGLAIVDNRPVRVGEAVDGFTLTKVAADVATFEREGEVARLRLQRDAALFGASDGEGAGAGRGDDAD